MGQRATANRTNVLQAGECVGGDGGGWGKRSGGQAIQCPETLRQIELQTLGPVNALLSAILETMNMKYK